MLTRQVDVSTPPDTCDPQKINDSAQSVSVCVVDRLVEWWVCNRCANLVIPLNIVHNSDSVTLVGVRTLHASSFATSQDVHGLERVS